MPDRKRVVTLLATPSDLKTISVRELAVSFRRRPEHGSRSRGGSASKCGSRWRVVMLFLLTAWIGWRPAASAQNAAPAAGNDSGVFEILSGSKRVGVEKFEIRTAESGWVATGELQLQGPDGKKVSETSSLKLNPSLLPVYYERIQKSPRNAKLVAQFGPSETDLETTTGEGQPFQQIFYLPMNDLAILDTNFFHHFTLLLRLYDQTKGMAQNFNVFIPQESLPGTISLQYLSRESVPVGSTVQELDHYRAVTDELKIEIWATPEGAIQRISIPQADLEVVRQ